MSKQLMPLALIVLVLVAGSWLLAQQPGAPKAAANPQGTFQVSGSGDGALLLETTTGKTWMLRRFSQGRNVWVPVQRIDSQEEVQKLMDKERQLELERGLPK